MDMQTLIREDARLVMLKALAEQVDESLNSGILVEHLRMFGIRCVLVHALTFLGLAWFAYLVFPRLP